MLLWVSTESSDGLGLACAIFGGAFGALGLFVWRRGRAEGARRAAEQHLSAEPSPARWRLALVATFFVLYVGLEVCFAGWIATYAHELDLGSNWGTAFTAAFWAGFLAGRLRMSVAGDRFDTGRVMWGSVSAATVLAVIMALVGNRPTPILVVSGLFGVLIAPQFPTMLTHLHGVFPLTGTVTAWCIGGSAVGGLLLPPLIGALFDRVGAAALPWTVAAASLASAAVLAVIDRRALMPPAPTVPTRRFVRGVTLRDA